MRNAIGSPHPGEELIERFLACQATREENRAVVLHLLRRCFVCRAIVYRRCRPSADAEYELVLCRVIDAWAQGCA
jgi:hypothetical protein